MYLTVDMKDQYYGPNPLSSSSPRQIGPGHGVCSLLRLSGMSRTPHSTLKMFLADCLEAATALKNKGVLCQDGKYIVWTSAIYIESAVLCVVTSDPLQQISRNFLRELQWHEFLVPQYKKYNHEISYFMTSAERFCDQIGFTFPHS